MSKIKTQFLNHGYLELVYDFKRLTMVPCDIGAASMLSFVVLDSAFIAGVPCCIRSCAQELPLSLPTSKLWKSNLISQRYYCPLVAIHKSMFEVRRTWI